MKDRGHTNSVPWMYAIGLNESGLTESTNCVHSWYGVGVTPVIHGTELVWPRTFMVRSWCDRGHSWYEVDVTASIHGTELVLFRKVIPRGSCVHCTVEIHLADFFLLSSMTSAAINLLCVSVTIRINRVVHSQHNFSATWIIKMQWTIIFNK